MPGLLDFVKDEIVCKETIELVPNGSIDFGRRVRVHVQRPGKENCKSIYSEPVLCIKVENPAKINLNKIVESVSLEIGGNVIDKIYSNQININQHKYSIMPKQYANTILIPLPFTCLLKTHGIPLHFVDYYEHAFTIELSENKENRICDGYLFLNYTYVNKELDYSDFTNLNYKQMGKSRHYKDSIIKINNKPPENFTSYYFINELLSMPLKQNCRNLQNISQEINKPTVSTTTNSSNQPNPNEQDKFNETVFYLNTENKSFCVPVNLLKINQSQFTGDEILDFKKGSNAKFRLAFNSEITNLYIQLNVRQVEQTGFNGQKTKWFDMLRIQVNGYDKLNFTWESLCLNKDNSNYNLPEGVLEIPNCKYIDWNAQSIVLLFSKITLPDNINEALLTICADSDNYLVCGSQSKLMF